MTTERYPQFAEDLVVMGLTIADTPLTLTVLKEQYNKLSLLRHPDKNPPEESRKYTELFQNLGNSYQRLRQYVFNNTDVNQISGEEANLYEFFEQNNSVQLNNGSVTINIENCRARQWLKVLTSKFGDHTLNPDGMPRHRPNVESVKLQGEWS